MHWHAVAQIQMNAYAHSRKGPRDTYAIVKGPAVRQQRCARHNSVAMCLRDAAIHAGGPSQVVRIDDQILHITCTDSAAQPVLSDSYLVAIRSHFVPLTDSYANSSMA